MIQAKCIQKFRDKAGKIYGYRLIDLNGNTQDVQPDNLKTAIRNKQIQVVNLTLTSDNRLLDTKEKQLQSKALGEAPIVPEIPPIVEDTKYNNVAKALILLDKEQIGMGDDYEEAVENIVYSAYNNSSEIDKLKSKYASNEREQELDKLAHKAYMHLLNNKPDQIEFILNSWTLYSYDTFERHIQYENVNSISKSNIYKALSLVYKYTKENKLSKKVVEPLYKFLNRVKTTGVASINMGYTVGNNYYRYLDGNKFGTISNDVFTVGHTITASDTKEHKEYKGYNYVFHKDINKCGSPAISIAALFKNARDGNVQVDIKIERHGYKTPTRSCVGIAGYILNVESFVLYNDADKEDCARVVANKFNELAPKLYDLADVHQSLYSSLGYELPLEVVSLADLNSHGSISGKRLVDLAISRWTKIRGERTPARVDMMDYRSDTSFYIIYANNISGSGNDRRLYIKYNGKEVTLKVLEGNDINKVVIEETMEMTGSVIDNSIVLSEVMAKALIKADVKRI